MIFYCTKDFKNEFAKLLRKNSYKKLEKLFISDILKKTMPELISGTKLFSIKKPHILKIVLVAEGILESIIIL